jgi:hypothetical protein
MNNSPWVIKDSLSNAIMSISINVEHLQQVHQNPACRDEMNYVNASHSRPCILMFPSSKTAESFRVNHLKYLQNSRLVNEPYEMNVHTTMCITKHFPKFLETNPNSHVLESLGQTCPLLEYDDNCLFSLAMTSYAVYL